MKEQKRNNISCINTNNNYNDNNNCNYSKIWNRCCKTSTTRRPKDRYDYYKNKGKDNCR